MSLCEVKNLSHQFGDKILYKNAEFVLYKGEHTGIVGPNGVGKSTLIKILTGQVSAEQGQIDWQPNLSLGYLDQHATLDSSKTIVEYLKSAFQQDAKKEERMIQLYDMALVDQKALDKATNLQEQLCQSGYYDSDTLIEKTATGLGLLSLGMDHKLGQLSGGQRAKVILAKLLLQKPDILLLDEPTNFLDRQHILWLQTTLKNMKTAYLIVSHDFEFLQQVTNTILDIEFGVIQKYYGSYQDYVKQKAQHQKEYIRRYESQKRMIEQTEAFIRKNIAGVNTKIAQGRRTRLARVERLTPPQNLTKPVFVFDELSCPSQVILTVDKLSIGYQEPLLPQLNFKVIGKEKMVITGFNGIGKSTLLKTLIGQLTPLAGQALLSPQIQFAYFQQDLKWEDPNLTPWQIISNRFPWMKLEEIRRRLAQLSIRAEHFDQAVKTLSGGEQAKVKLCIMLVKPSNLLILDEPTNHLDALSKESLKQALTQYEGSVILVSHEESFYRDWTDRLLKLTNK